MLALLPMLGFGGMLCSLALVHVQKDLRLATVQRHAFRTSLWGRIIWLGTILWPLLGLGLEWPAWVIWGGVLLVIALAQTAIWAGASSFTTWTQSVVPLRQRGHFFAWRNTVSFGVLSLTLGITGFFLPEGGQGADPEGTLRVLMWLFAITTLLAIVAAWPLAWSPGVPKQAIKQIVGPRPSIWSVLKRHAPSANAQLWFFHLSFECDLLNLYGKIPRRFGGWRRPHYPLARIVANTIYARWYLAWGWLLTRLGGKRMLAYSTCGLLLAQGGFSFFPWRTRSGFYPSYSRCGASVALPSASSPLVACRK